jgi:hypothetical protein
MVKVICMNMETCWNDFKKGREGIRRIMERMNQSVVQYMYVDMSQW